ncbi:hypothetical protein [Deinococcus actinosclerus]|uniref:Uncharacterized protein n=1 Tax=Deinococcus actinosclerus TaxID=1768108 RepID=A0ABN4K634_9DEIO|nr:hypothetical protein [Deinococcus actinosclerus]ALW88379.1 hypothetical protein AUC44_05290 [Deinococcus actinosclerus]
MTDVKIITPNSSAHWTDPDLRGDVANTSEFTVDLQAYDQGQALGLDAFHFEIWNDRFEELDWLQHATMPSLLIVSEPFAQAVSDLSPDPPTRYPVRFERRGVPVQTRPYVVLQLGPPRDYFDADRSDFTTRTNYRGQEVISAVQTYRLNLPACAPPVFRLSVSPHHPTFATAAFLAEARQRHLTNVAWMDAAGFSAANQLRPL